MSRESRAKQREFLKLARPFFDKSLVRSFSSFEKPHYWPGTLPSPPGFAELILPVAGLFVRMLDSLGGDKCNEPAHIGLELPTQPE